MGFSMSRHNTVNDHAAAGARAAAIGAVASSQTQASAPHSYVEKLLSALAKLGIAYTAQSNVARELAGPSELKYEKEFNEELKAFYDLLSRVDAEGIITKKMKKKVL